MISRFVLALVLSLSFSSLSYSQTQPTEIVDRFFEEYNKAGSDKAIEYYFGNNKYFAEISAGLTEVKQQLTSFLNVSGKFAGYELLTKKYAGPNILMLTYIVKFERLPATFRFSFYRPNDKWQVQNFKFDTRIFEELEEASRIPVLNQEHHQ
ncbi:MAG: hypothetical protein P0Y53_21610 [Candidatus Pseudobacter hemicellulosilyticus]|uniref:DUF4783 domain-containing protein n=1 Tax=Candidatus Pseudobacter hemicellulosilyticus TaxID=3121375 RepID=A0AAJ5WQX0_9BACT|nr:MAG: hypothetical protein P0Y53_21610 [Pseudobacter sp.]